MAEQAFNNTLISRERNVSFAYSQWLQGLSEAEYLTELDRVRNNGIGNPATS